jgi:hypothetical protein
MHKTCGFIDTTCAVHAGSLTPHAHIIHKENFEQPSKSENHRWNGLAMQKNKNAGSVIDTGCLVNAVSLTPDVRCMRCHWHRMCPLSSERFGERSLCFSCWLVWEGNIAAYILGFRTKDSGRDQIAGKLSSSNLCSSRAAVLTPSRQPYF